MSRKVGRVPVHLDSHGVDAVLEEEIRLILRAADPLVMAGGRGLLVKILKGSKSKDVLDKQLDSCPAYGFYEQLTAHEVAARVDWVIEQGYLRIEYDYRLPLLVFTDKGWAIERETYADELLQGFDDAITAGQTDRDMTYLKDRDRGLILRLLEKIEATGDRKYVPLLEAWAKVDYAKVRARLGQVIRKLSTQESP
jgi:hypothetical protein